MHPDSSVMCVFGTRPEVVKLAPVIYELRRRSIPCVICVTGQQREMLHQILDVFKLTPDYDLDIMIENQTLEHVTSRTLSLLQPVLQRELPGTVLVQGDTTTAFAGALAAFYQKIPVGHVEAGLRTDDIYNPFPEEMNRRMISQLASWHFAPTQSAAENLKRDGVLGDRIFLTGNTVIDALQIIAKEERPYENEVLANTDFAGRRVVLVTTHRRENLGDGMESIFAAIRKLAEEVGDSIIVFPVHLNPLIREHSKKALGGLPNVLMLEPVNYTDMCRLLKECYLVMTDSGGLQEEAPSLGKPVIILRKKTERPEGVKAGVAVLAGTNADSILAHARKLMNDEDAYLAMAQAKNPYGDGRAAGRIVDQIAREQHAANR